MLSRRVHYLGSSAGFFPLMKLLSLPTVLTLALGSAAVAGIGSNQTCSRFKLNIPNVRLNATTHFAANASISLTTPQSSLVASDLPAFCRLQLAITTNTTAGSTALAEVWLPDAWNGRSMTVGNGGFSGGSMPQNIRYLAEERLTAS